MKLYKFNINNICYNIFEHFFAHFSVTLNIKNRMNIF